ncbi:hypothetical protein AQUCO_00200177v1 [Aquilegia coerulea]|uniref:Subtilisin-like protease fibronectin type-III domain-containing protein n=1 Tax=Aquilegia coerulea TaxID=218851 RepID=A0A2G5F1V0_AQUCA|nr:hypothetical protein AQUCO_00200177v1 [Aquilegia coerulea]
MGRREEKRMEISRRTCFFFNLFILFLITLLHTPTIAIKKSYVVYLGAHSHGMKPTSIDFDRVTDSHHDFLGSFLGSKEKAKDAMIYSYTRHINGFAATLEENEAEEISRHPDVVSVFLNKEKELQTTHSWDFLGVIKDNKIPHKSILKKAKLGENVIIGNIDSGVWPESESFNDKGMGPVPARWKGFCQNNTNVGVRCNRKLIGARYFVESNSHVTNNDMFVTASARDIYGHGTHTLATAGGRFVPNVNIYGLGNGTAKGGAPNARVAAYKACWPTEKVKNSCKSSDVIAAFDAAIHDGVDVLSVSLGEAPEDYLTEGVAIGSFHAVMNGITVVCSAGNRGPLEGSVQNVAPWILTVGATTMDRDFLSYVVLGNNICIKGRSISSEVLSPENLYPLINAVDGKVGTATDEYAKVCSMGSLDPAKVSGKIVVCLKDKHALGKEMVVVTAGGIGMILVNDDAHYFEETYAEPHSLPIIFISAPDGRKLFSYIASTNYPVAHITPPETKKDVKPSPNIASFSCRGPNSITPEILKPDIVAPGVNIISAVSLANGASSQPFDHKSRVLFNSKSGTSMACPHVSGIVGLLKAIHPDWSPAAIKSAIMTTATTRSNTKKPILNGGTWSKGTPFDYGAGFIHPNGAMDPGLVYDLTVDDYLDFLCAEGYNKTQITKFTIKPRTCKNDDLSLLDFNYPAITVPYLNGSVTVTRTVKNVGSPGTYTVTVTEPFGVSVRVDPERLMFDKIGEEKTFKVTMEVVERVINNYVFGTLEWSDGIHNVRSPISIMQAMGNGILLH